MTNDNKETLGMIRDQASRLLKKSASPELLKMLLDQPTGFDSALWSQAVEQGWPAVALAEEADGLGLGWSGLSLLMEEIGRYTASLPLIGNAVAASAGLESADAGLLEHFVKPLASGELMACLALNIDRHSSLPRLSGEHLSGETSLVPFAAVADFALVQAQHDGSPALVLVKLDNSGVTRQIELTLDNARCAARLRFEQAECTPLSLEDAGVTASRLAGMAALATAFEQIGGAASCLQMARDYALERKAFGQPIGRFQSIKHKLSDMYWRLEIARGCAIDALEAAEEGNPLSAALAAAARLGAIEAYEFAAKENIQVHGGLGVTWEAMPHHFYRRARCLSLELGSAYEWRDYMLREAGIDQNA